ncbi:uncharacterized protein [Procambarus clarkii]|uniref:uncharacterized protein n=1 Tax=Procambarus clarkii TaxID=6728 RepID=UPI003744A0CD
MPERHRSKVPTGCSVFSLWCCSPVSVCVIPGLSECVCVWLTPKRRPGPGARACVCVGDTEASTRTRRVCVCVWLTPKRRPGTRPVSSHKVWSSTSARMVNCTIIKDYPGWVIASTYGKCFVSVLGAVGNSMSLWCLVKCGRTNKATKFLLCFFFSILLGVCVVTLPSISFVNHARAFCQYEWVPEGFYITTSIFSTFLIQFERVNFTAISVFRCVAVWEPHVFHKVSRVSIVLIMEAVLAFYVVLPWLLGVILSHGDVHYDGKVSQVKFGEKSLNDMVYRWYGVNYTTTFLATLLAYILLIVAIVRREKRAGERTTDATMDHVSFTIQVILLANLLLDGPHVIVHLLEGQRLANIIIHMIFNLHLVIDPAVFVGLNVHYRSAVLHRIKTCVPHSVAALISSQANTTDMNIPVTPPGGSTTEPFGLHNKCINSHQQDVIV